MTTASHPIAKSIIGFMLLWIGVEGDRPHTNRPPKGIIMSIHYSERNALP